MTVRTNTVSVRYAIEQSLGTLPGSPSWKLLEPNEINQFGATIATVARNPISENRQNLKGTITDLDSNVELVVDTTVDSFLDFAEGFMFANRTAVPRFDPTAVTASAYTVASGGALAQRTLIFARDFTNTANNGLKVVGAGSTATAINTSGLTVEASPPAASEVEVVGFRGASGDLEIDSNGNLISTTLDFTTLGLTIGQAMWIGGADTANQFATAANAGFVRIRAISANLITLEKRDGAFSTDDGTGKEIDIYFGPFIRNLPSSDANFIERSYQFETIYDGLQSGSDEFEYAIGNLANTVAIEMPLTDKSTTTFGFIGTDTEVLTTTRKTNAANAEAANKTTSFNTTSDFVRLRLQNAAGTNITDVGGTGSTGCVFKSLTLNINNNVSPEKVIGKLGARFMNFGNFEVTGETQLLFDDSRVANAVRNNETIGLDWALQNDDGAIYFDVPSMTLGGGDKEFPVNETVLINITGNVFRDDFYGYSMGITYFPYLPPKSV